MKLISRISCGVLLALVMPVATTGFQEPPNSRASITDDYRQVTIVAHVDVQKVERVEQIGGYVIYRITSKMLELFKGKFPSDTDFIYYVQIEYGIDMDHYKGPKIVFVSLHNNDEATEYRALENSDREPTEKVIKVLRELKRSQNRSTHQ